MLIQYPIVRSEFSDDQLKQLKEIFRTSQEQVFWMIDGLDESASYHRAQCFLERNEQLFHKSVFLVLTRSEGKKILSPVTARRAEFSMNDLDPDQCRLFVEKFPFFGKKERNRIAKRKAVLEALEANQVIKEAFPIPINAVMICALFNDDSFSGEQLENQLDILDALIGMNIKATRVKTIEMQLTLPTTTEEQQLQLSNSKNAIMRKSPLSIFEEKKPLLVKLSQAMFICNGNSLVGFQKLDEESLRNTLSKLSVSLSDVEFLLHLDILDHGLD